MRLNQRLQRSFQTAGAAAAWSRVKLTQQNNGGGTPAVIFSRGDFTS